MNPTQDNFDASQVQPQYSVGSNHPVGLFDAQITNTSLKPVKDKPANGMFVIEYSTPAGKIEDRFNLWNESPQAVEISQKQLSAVCHATGVFRIASFKQNQGAELRGARLKIEVGYQKNHEPSSTNPTGGYTEVKKVFDAAGNEPGKGPAGAPQTQQPGQAAWNAPANTGAPLQQAPNGSWGTTSTAPAAQANPVQQVGGNTGWQQNPPANAGNAAPTPPWGK